MVKYTIWLDEPTDILHAAIKNLGTAVRDKDGIFTVSLVDEDKKPLNKNECNLAISKHFDECYVYVSATPETGLIRMGTISASRPFQGIHIRYEAVFTDQPLDPSQLGPLFYTVSAGARTSKEKYTITKMTKMDAVQEPNQK